MVRGNASVAVGRHHGVCGDKRFHSVSCALLQTRERNQPRLKVGTMKVSTGISLLLYLQKANRIMKVKELAGLFQMSERNIYRYLEELSVGGIPIVTLRGRYGGVKILRGSEQ